MSTIRVENNTVRPIGLAPTESFTKGFVLQPGLNTVPKLFWDEYTTYEVEMEAKGGKKPKVRQPGREAIERYQRPCDIWTHDGMRHGPMITVYPEGAVIDRPDGPPPPLHLPDKPEIAKKLIDVTNDKSALARWSKEAGEKRPEIRNYVEAKLASLRG